MKKRYSVITVMLVAVITLSAVLDLNLRLRRYFNEFLADNLVSDTITNVGQTNELIENKYNLLEYIANTSVVRETPPEALDFGTNMPGFLRMSVYRSDGNGYCNKKFLGNFTGHDFFERSMHGERFLYVSSYTGSGEFVFSVPVKDNYGNTQSVLVGVCSSMMFYNHMMVNHGTNQRVLIYDNIGRLVMRDPTVKDKALNMNKNNQIESVLADMKEGKNGVVTAPVEGKSGAVAYRKLNVNNWYIVSVDTVNPCTRNVFIGSNIQLGIKLLIVLLILGLYYYFSRRSYREQLARVQDETSLLTKTIPGSTVMCKLDELLTIKYASEAMYTKLGYTTNTDRPMLTLGLREIIHPDDLRGFNKLFDEFKNTNAKFEYECRFICKNGKPRWMNCYARFVHNINGIKNLYLVAIDISEQKETEHRLQISEERYKVVIKQSNSIVFEYNIKTHEYFVTNNFYEVFNVSANSGDIFAVFMKQHRLHSDDKYKFEHMLSDVYSRCGFREEELRIMDSTKKYVWYSLKITSINDTGSAPARIIGNLSNIDSVKKSTIELENQAQSDALTGCYNRETSLAVIRRLIENETEEALSALIIIDIDHFRIINDRFGHDVGDDLLRKTGRMLKNQVRSSDIVGRIGDDEFIIFLRGCTAMSQITNKIESFVKEAHKITSGGFNETTFSIGAAIYPTNSKDYDDLYDMADKAVYISKTTGCDKYTLYDSEQM